MMDRRRYEQITSQYAQKSILVAGDLMIDAYLWGDAQRISPEAPVPVVHIKKTNENPGGAGNVVANLRMLGAKVSIIGIVGDDLHGENLINQFEQNSVNTSGILRDKSRPTSVKTRVIAQSQQVVRIDQECLDHYSAGLYASLQKLAAEMIKNHDALIIEDYNKGLLTTAFIQTLIEISNDENIPVYVDPKKQNINAFHHVRLFKPNFPEFLDCIQDEFDEKRFLEQGMKLRDQLHVELLMVTRGKDGIALFSEEGMETIPTKARRVHDVSGAGDSVISTFTLSDLSGATPAEAAILANYAAGKVCEEVGVVPISLEKLSEIIDYHNRS